MTPKTPHSPESAARLLGEKGGFRHLIEGVPAIVYVDAVDDVSTALYMSPQSTEILGFTPDEWLASPDLWVKQMHPEDLDWVVDANIRSNATGEPFRAEYRLLAKDGRDVWIRDEATIVYDDDGRPLFWRGVMMDITELKRAEAKLKRSLDMLRGAMAERRMLLGRLEETREQERRRIAADIHDDSIQVMASVGLQLQTFYEHVSGDRREELRGLGDTVNQAIDRLRHLVFELRPPALDADGLVAALREYLQKTSKEAGFEFGIDDFLDDDPEGDARTTLYRIGQEAITNVRKHAGAARVNVLLETKGAGVLVRISDDGKGFSVDSPELPKPGHLGLIAMRERAELSGGWCNVESKPGEGTTVEFWLPTQAEDDSKGERSA